jgi:ubiquinone/menaquinone biosynthesis C-methylase UbiE
VATVGVYGDRVLPHVINVVMNTKQTRGIRRRVCAGLEGEVLEIGFGTGHNLPYLPADVTKLLAVEPSARSVALARERIDAAPVEVDVIGLDGQRLPVPDASVDAVLCTWSLCTIPDAVAAVREARRVLRPGGRFHFIEHGRAPDEPVRRWQDRLNGIQQRIGGGCHLNRDIAGIVEAGGMTIIELDRYYNPGEPKAFGAMYEGVATAASA